MHSGCHSNGKSRARQRFEKRPPLHRPDKRLRSRGETQPRKGWKVGRNLNQLDLLISHDSRGGLV
jgi:hypothetical protein